MRFMALPGCIAFFAMATLLSGQDNKDSFLRHRKTAAFHGSQAITGWRAHARLHLFYRGEDLVLVTNSSVPVDLLQRHGEEDTSLNS